MVWLFCGSSLDMAEKSVQFPSCETISASLLFTPAELDISYRNVNLDPPLLGSHFFSFFSFSSLSLTDTGKISWVLYGTACPFLLANFD